MEGADESKVDDRSQARRRVPPTVLPVSDYKAWQWRVGDPHHVQQRTLVYDNHWWFDIVVVVALREELEFFMRGLPLPERYRAGSSGMPQLPGQALFEWHAFVCEHFHFTMYETWLEPCQGVRSVRRVVASCADAWASKFRRIACRINLLGICTAIDSHAHACCLCR